VADDGARQIQGLLVTSSDTLADAMDKIGDGLRFEKGGTDIEAGRSAFQGIKEAREYYGGLARRIRRIHTSAESKHDVLDAIGRLDSGLALFAKGLKTGSGTDKGAERISAGADRMQEAARDLATATNALT
jgi:hypothetical protein